MNRLSSGFAWKLLERFGVQGIQFLLQIILARLLVPEDYGVLSLMLVFTSIATVFIQSGFNTSLIQNKDVDDRDYSSVFWVSLCVAAILYGIIFISAPVIAIFYDMPSLVTPLRVMALVLLPGAFNSVQIARVSRELDFKKIFYSSIGGILVGGISGVILAFLGAGVWALIAQNLINTIASCLIMFYTVDWKPKILIDWKRIKVLFSFGWKLLVSSLIETVYQDLQSLIIGKKYNKETLGYCNRGKQFPQFAITAINSTVQSVMLPAMSEKQEDWVQVKKLMRQSIILSSYIIFPMMAGLAGTAAPLVSVILTDKWLPCVPYMQIYCFAFAFYPVHSCNLQAINAMGRSDIYLKLEIAKKAVGMAMLGFTVICFNSPIAIAMTSVLIMPIGIFINAYPNKKLVHYSYLEQLKDIFPSFLIALSMCGIVLLVGRLQINRLLLLTLQVFIGISYYIVFSAILKLDPYIMLLNKLKKIMKIRNY